MEQAADVPGISELCARVALCELERGGDTGGGMPTGLSL